MGVSINKISKENLDIKEELDQKEICEVSNVEANRLISPMLTKDLDVVVEMPSKKLDPHLSWVLSKEMSYEPTDMNYSDFINNLELNKGKKSSNELTYLSDPTSQFPIDDADSDYDPDLDEVDDEDIVDSSKDTNFSGNEEIEITQNNASLFRKQLGISEKRLISYYKQYLDQIQIDENSTKEYYLYILDIIAKKQALIGQKSRPITHFIERKEDIGNYVHSSLKKPFENLLIKIMTLNYVYEEFMNLKLREINNNLVYINFVDGLLFQKLERTELLTIIRLYFSDINDVVINKVKFKG